MIVQSSDDCTTLPASSFPGNETAASDHAPEPRARLDDPGHYACQDAYLARPDPLIDRTVAPWPLTITHPVVARRLSVSPLHRAWNVRRLSTGLYSPLGLARTGVCARVVLLACMSIFHSSEMPVDSQVLRRVDLVCKLAVGTIKLAHPFAG